MAIFGIEGCVIIVCVLSMLSYVHRFVTNLFCTKNTNFTKLKDGISLVFVFLPKMAIIFIARQVDLRYT